MIFLGAMTGNEVIIAAGAVVAVAILGLGVVVCVVALCAAALDRLAPLPPATPDVGLTDAEIALLCADDESFDRACALELAYREPCAPDPRMLA